MRTLDGLFADPLRALDGLFADPLRALDGLFTDPLRALDGLFTQPLRAFDGLVAQPLRAVAEFVGRPLGSVSELVGGPVQRLAGGFGAVADQVACAFHAAGHEAGRLAQAEVVADIADHPAGKVGTVLDGIAGEAEGAGGKVAGHVEGAVDQRTGDAGGAFDVVAACVVRGYDIADIACRVLDRAAGGVVGLRARLHGAAEHVEIQFAQILDGVRHQGEIVAERAGRRIGRVLLERVDIRRVVAAAAMRADDGDGACGCGDAQFVADRVGRRAHEWHRREILLRQGQRVAIDDVAADLAAVGDLVAHGVGVEAQAAQGFVAQSGGIEGHGGRVGGQRRCRCQPSAQRMAGEHHVAGAERALRLARQRDRLVVLRGVQAERLAGVGADVSPFAGIGAGIGHHVVAFRVLVDRRAETAGRILEHGRVDRDLPAVAVDQMVALRLQPGPSGGRQVALRLRTGQAIGPAEAVGVVGHLGQLQVEILLRLLSCDVAAEAAVAWHNGWRARTAVVARAVGGRLLAGRGQSLQDMILDGPAVMGISVQTHDAARLRSNTKTS